MPIFARRRLHSMLDDISPLLSAPQKKGIVKRLADKNTGNALAAEAELALLWAVSKVSDLAIEPPIANSTRLPDAFSANLFLSRTSAIEIRAVSDDGFSGKDDMDRTANIISSYADTLRGGASKHLYFEFLDISYWNKVFHRDRCVDPNFKLTDNAHKVLEEWITDKNWPNPLSINLTEGKTDVIITWKERTVRQFRTFSKMPPVAYDLEKNPVYKAIKDKALQMKGCGSNVIKCLFLMDVGCNLLRNLRGLGGGMELSGEKIIAHALKKNNIDIICVFSPTRTQRMFLQPQTELFWRVTCFDKRSETSGLEHKNLEMVAAQLPRPNYEGYQARDMHKQRMFQPESMDQLPSQYVYEGGKMTIKVSSRLLLQVMSGQMTQIEFQQQAFGNGTNPFTAANAQRLTIQKASIENGGLDNDDDYLVFDLDHDWGTKSYLKKID